jgi:hypothetical protein
MTMTGLKPSRYYRVRYAARNIIYDSGNMFDCDQLQWSESVTVLTAVTSSTPQNLH